MTQLHNKYYWGLAGNIAILLALLVLYFFHILDDANNFATDLFSRYSSPSFPAEQRSLLINCTPEQNALGNNVWIDLISDLDQKGARQIIFLNYPSGAGKELLQRGSKNPKVFFANTGFSLNKDQENNLQEMIDSTMLQSGPVSIPSPQNGVYRSQFATLTAKNNTTSFHLISLAAGKIREDSAKVTDTYRVNFIGRAEGSQPVVDFQLALSGHLVESLVANKTVFIGLKPTSPFSGLLTPINRDGSLTSPAVFTAYSYDSLVNGKIITRSSNLTAFLIFTFFVVAGTFFTQFMRAGLALLWAFSVFLFAIALAWAMYIYALVQLPLAELLLGQFLLILLIITGKSLIAEEKLGEVAFTTKQKVQERLLPTDIYNSQQYWVQVVGMVSQLLNLDRSIFLEKVQGGTRVHEVAAANTSINDIHERRRDYNRFPYTEALAENGPIEVNDYLPAAENAEIQYLTPLRIAGGGVLGFWACSISVLQEQALAELPTKLNIFATQISEMLYAREQWQHERKYLQNPIRKLLTLESGDEKFDEIKSAFSILSKRLHTVETVFDSLGTGAILYNLFGQVIYANQKMVSLCRELEASPYKLSGAELVSLLTGLDLKEVRRMLSELISSGETTTYHTEELGEQKHTYLLTVKAVSNSAELKEHFSDDPINAFNTMGILLEIHELTNIQEITQQKEAYFNYSAQAFHGYKISFPPVIERLKQKDLPKDTQDKLVTFMEKRLSSLFDFIDRLRDIMERDMLDINAPYFPTDFVVCLQVALKKISEKADQTKFQFDLQLPDYMVPVLAVPTELETIFQNIISYLTQDAEPGSSITIDVHREHKFIVCTLKNKGYGMPDHDFHNYLNDDNAALSEEFQSLFAARNQIEIYGGQFIARSELGKGTEIVIMLKRFQ